MDDRQLTELIQRVLLRIQGELTSKPSLQKAYILMPENWRTQNQRQCVDIVKSLQGSYHTIAVLPDDDKCPDDLYDAGMCAVAKRSEVVFPMTEDFLTVLPIASRDLVVKTALCIQDCFETRWIGQCIAHGQPVFMRRESPMFTGREPAAYQRKIEAYYREAESFGICFDRLPTKCVITQQAAPSGAPVVNPVFQATTASAPVGKKRIVTAKDLAEVENNGVLKLNRGDVVTALAAEHAANRGIRFEY